MRQRSCSHRISELYNEIILTAKFQEKFCNKDSFYFENIYCSVFWDKDFQVKLLILDKETQNIIFENVCDSTYIFYNDLKADSFLYSFDLSNSTITKFNNPILNNGLVHNSIQEQHPFISLSKSINDIVIKDEVVYIIGEICYLGKTPFNFESETTIIDIDFDIFKNDNINNINFLLGLSSENLEILKGHYFAGGSILEIWNRNLKRKNSILIEYFNDEYQEYQSYLIDYYNTIIKAIHPSFLTKVSDKYLVSIPYTESSHYGRYEDFKLIRLADFEEFDLSNVLTELYQEAMHTDRCIADLVFFSSNDILVIGDYEFSCENLFSVKPKKPLEINKSSNLKSLIPIKGNYFDGYALEIHTIKSTLKEDGSFETLRTDLGEMLYQLKYNFDKSVIDKIAVKCADIINNLFADIDAIIPSPPSNLNRPFQPVYELAKRISELTDIKLDINYVSKLPTEQIKSLTESDDRNLVLERAISIKDDRYRNKNILLFDDLFRSGDTLNIIAKKLKNEGGINSIKALCVTKTRTKR